MATEFNIGSFIGRWAFAAILVFGTYNPTQYSYIGWVFGPLDALEGVALLIAWIIFLRATFLSMGWLGIILGAALFACVIWLFIDLGWLDLDSPSEISWVVLVFLSVILAVGMSWSHIRRRLSGQFDVDEKDD